MTIYLRSEIFELYILQLLFCLFSSWPVSNGEDFYLGDMWLLMYIL